MNYYLKKHSVKFQQGQMLIIVIFTMVISLTVGLTLASRTITNLKVSKENEQSSRAFTAAEAGIEQALKDQTAPPTTQTLPLSNNASFTYTIQGAPTTQMLLNGGDSVLQDKGVDVWLSDYPSYTNNYNGNLTVYWATTNPSTPVMSCTGSGANLVPALEIVILDGNINSPNYRKFFLDPCPAANRPGTNNATSVSGGGTTITDSSGSKTFLYGYTIPGAPSISNGLIAKVIPIYNSTSIGIIGAPTLPSTKLPSQGKVIESTGFSGDATRKLKYFVSYPQIPTEFFPYSIINQTYTGY